jgi:anti-sigma28 factor (negative regulator of flagellin synthesis)
MGMPLPPRAPDNSHDLVNSSSRGHSTRRENASVCAASARSRRIDWIRRRILDGSYHVPAELIAAAMLQELGCADSLDS